MSTYKVIVQDAKGTVNVKVEPQPIATDDRYIKIIAGKMQRILMDENVRNTYLGRNKLRKEIQSALDEFERQGMIKPKPKDE